jgi:hypothetical protein
MQTLVLSEIIKQLRRQPTTLRVNDRLPSDSYAEMLTAAKIPNRVLGDRQIHCVAEDFIQHVAQLAADYGDDLLALRYCWRWRCCAARYSVQVVCASCAQVWAVVGWMPNRSATMVAGRSATAWIMAVLRAAMTGSS